MTARPPQSELKPAPSGPSPSAPAPRRPPLPAARGSGLPSALDLIDEAALRLRIAPTATLGVYYAGSLPFILALLYFWTDMSQRADAAGATTGAALGMAMLFVGMKVAQAVFAARLRAQFGHRPAVRWTPARLGRLALVQTLLQPAGLFVLPMAAILTVPLGWVYAFYGNVTVLGDGGTASAREVFVRAARHAARDPKGNHLALLILSLLGMFAWLNLVIATLLLPQLARMFTGEENVFTRSGLHIFNSTFFAVTFGLVYLALDPLVKTFYALRCFYADAQHTGEDLQSGLLALPAPEPDGPGTTTVMVATAASARAAALAAWLVLALLVPDATSSAAVLAATPPPSAVVSAPSAANGVSAPALGRSIEEVLRRREFAWRAPRPPEKPEAAPSGAIEGFLAGIKKWYADTEAYVRRTWHTLKAWFHRWWHARPEDSAEEADANGGLDAATLRLLVYGLIALVAGTLALLVWRGRSRRRTGTLAGQAAPPAGAVAMPDLTDETVLASQLPEDEWLRLAQDLLGRGERRLALRAYYLSTLAALGTRGLLAVARHKSNRDYLQELRRRARDRAEVPEAFARNVGRFERVWYGSHGADDALLADFQADRELVLEDDSSPTAVPAILQT